MFSVQLLPETVAKIIKIKQGLNNKAHITQSKGCFFSVQLLLKKGLKLNEIKKAQQVQDNCLILVETVNEKFVYH